MRLLASVMLVLSSGALAHADLEPGHKVDSAAGKAQREAGAMASEAAELLSRGDATRALTSADRALAKYTRDPWAHYIRAEALVRLNRLDDALPEYRLAENAFGPEDRWGRSIALWGRANAFHQIGRCAEAKTAFGEYIAFVKEYDSQAITVAQARIDGCRPPWVNPAAKPPTTP